MENKILIGEVSRYYNISKQTLIHYDRIGLLHPSATEENGYRYYTFEDIDKLDVILSLKDTGLKLKDIRKFIENPSLEDSLKLLKSQNDILEDRIYKLNIIKEKLNHKIDEIKYINNQDFYNDIRVIEKEDRYILYKDIKNEKPDINNFPNALMMLKEQMQTSKFYSKYNHSLVCVIISSDNLEKKIFNNLSKLFVFIDNFSGRENELILKSGLYVCIQHHGLFSKTYESYENLYTFIEKNNYEIIGNALEMPLLSSWSVKSENEYITEIQIPVKKKLGK